VVTQVPQALGHGFRHRTRGVGHADTPEFRLGALPSLTRARDRPGGRAGLGRACGATATNVNDAVLFARLFLGAFAVMAWIRTVFADKGYDAEANRALCRAFGAEPCPRPKTGRKAENGGCPAFCRGSAKYDSACAPVNRSLSGLSMCVVPDTGT
jgi:hypothetical protein